MTADTQLRDRIFDFQNSVVHPMARENRYAELCKVLKLKLKGEQDRHFRFLLMQDLVLYLGIAGDEQSSYEWAVRTCDEFDESPIAWVSLAQWYLHSSPAGHGTPEERRMALGHYKTALQRAHSANEWVRYVLFDICRLLTKQEDYVELEATMREVISDLNTKREIDIPRIEGEWLDRVPEGRLDANLVARYRQVMAADAARMPRRGYNIHPATLDELEG